MQFESANETLDNDDDNACHNSRSCIEGERYDTFDYAFSEVLSLCLIIEYSCSLNFLAENRYDALVTCIMCMLISL